MSTVTASNSYVGRGSGGRRPVTAAGGLVFVVALVASVAAASSPPKADASADAIVGYFSDHHTAAVASTMIGVVAAIAYLCFIGALRASLEGRPGATLLPAAAGAQIAMIGLWLSINGVLAQNVARTANGELTSALFGLGEKAYAAVDIGAATVLVAAGVAAYGSARFPRWLAVLPLAVAFPATLNAIIGIGVKSGPFAPGGPVDVVASLGFLVWVASTSIVMLRTPTAEPSGPGQPRPQ